MRLEQLRRKRADQVLRKCGLARATIRAGRTDLARIAREWNGIAKRINAALKRYALTVEDLEGVYVPDELQPRELLNCLKGCTTDEQTTRLDDIEGELKEHAKQIRAAGRKRDRRLAKRAGH
jgi:hypothetical protein